MWMLTGANGYALDAADTRFEAMVMDDGHVVALGSTAELRAQFGVRVQQIKDLDGATVIPGLVDSHLHLAAVGDAMMQLDLTGAASLDAVLAAVRAFALSLPAGAWVIGNGWDEHHFTAPGLPTPEQLDAAAAGRPVLLTRVCRHVHLAGAAALRQAGIADMSVDPPDGRFGRDLSGRLNGLVYENASRALFAAMPLVSREAYRQMIDIGTEAVLAAGITAVHTDDTRSLRGFVPVWELYTELRAAKGARLRVHELVDWHYLEECRQYFADSGERQEPGWLEVGAAKLFADGSFGGRTAWLAQPYTDDGNNVGQPIYSAAQLADRIAAAYRSDFAVAVHAIGDAALAAALAALRQARAGRAGARRLPDRVVHAQLVDAELVAQLQQFGDSVVIDIQPRFVCSDFPWISQRLGGERVSRVCAWKTLALAGLRLAGGSDAPVEPVNPLLGIHAAVTRRTPAGAGPWEVQEALSRRQALHLFTRGACFANSSDALKGCLAPGWLADFTVIDRDIVAAPDPDVLLAARVLMTGVGGDIAWSQAGAP